MTPPPGSKPIPQQQSKNEGIMLTYQSYSFEELVEVHTVYQL